MGRRRYAESTRPGSRVEECIQGSGSRHKFSLISPTYGHWQHRVSSLQWSPSGTSREAITKRLILLSLPLIMLLAACGSSAAPASPVAVVAARVVPTTSSEADPHLYALAAALLAADILLREASSDVQQAHDALALGLVETVRIDSGHDANEANAGGSQLRPRAWPRSYQSAATLLTLARDEFQQSSVAYSRSAGGNSTTSSAGDRDAAKAQQALRQAESELARGPETHMASVRLRARGIAAHADAAEAQIVLRARVHEGARARERARARHVASKARVRATPAATLNVRVHGTVRFAATHMSTPRPPAPPRPSATSIPTPTATSTRLPPAPIPLRTQVASTARTPRLAAVARTRVRVDDAERSALVALAGRIVRAVAPLPIAGTRLMRSESTVDFNPIIMARASREVREVHLRLRALERDIHRTPASRAVQPLKRGILAALTSYRIAARYLRVASKQIRSGLETPAQISIRSAATQFDRAGATLVANHLALPPAR